MQFLPNLQKSDAKFLPHGTPLLQFICPPLTLEPVDLLLQLLDRPLGELGARLGLEENSREEGTVRSIEKAERENENEILAEVQQRSQMTDICGCK